MMMLCVHSISCVPRTTLDPLYDHVNATVDVSVDVEGEGFTTGWHISVAHQPSMPDPFTVIEIQRDDCPLEHDSIYGEFRIYGDYISSEDSFEVTQFAYRTLDECMLEHSSDSWYGATEPVVSGKLVIDVTQTRYRMVFEDFRVQVSAPEPPLEGVVISAVTFNGTYTARGRHNP